MTDITLLQLGGDRGVDKNNIAVITLQMRNVLCDLAPRFVGCEIY